MTELREARLTLRPLSPFLSPLQSDTLWGHVAWAIYHAEGYGEEYGAHKRFTDRYREEDGVPPLVLSAAFPAGTLPAPVLRPLTREEQEALARDFYGGTGSEELRLVAAALKQIARVRHLDMAAWRNLVEGLHPLDLARRFFRLELCPELGVLPARVDCHGEFAKCPIFSEGRCQQVARWRKRWLRAHGPGTPMPVCLSESDIVTKNTINRLTDTTVAGEGSLYIQEETVYTGRLEVWLLLAEDLAADLARVRGWFEAVGRGGFGARASVGKGRFAVEELALVPEEPDAAAGVQGLPRDRDADAFMALGAYVPRAGDPREGQYRLRVKRGKLGAEFAASSLPVWKKPLLMCEPGSVFEDVPPEQWYGRTVEGISSYADGVVQYGLTPALPVRLLKEAGGGGVP